MIKTEENSAEKTEEEKGFVFGAKIEDRAAQITQNIRELLIPQFGKLDFDEDAGKIGILLDDVKAAIYLPSLNVECENSLLKERIEAILKRVKVAVFPVPN